MKYEVEITARAEAELEEAYRWIRRDSPERAAAWRKGLLKVTSTLERFPNRCGLAAESSARREIRQFMYGSYRLLFVIEGSTVVVLHIRHAARQQLSAEELAEGEGGEATEED